MSKAKSRGNGQGSVYKDGATWTATITLGYYLDKDGKRKRKIKRKKGFRTKTDAINYLPMLRAMIDPPEKRTISQLWEYWSRNGMLKLAGSTQRGMKKAYERIEEIHFCDIADLTLSRVQEIITAKTTSYYTARDIQTLIRHLIQVAIADKIAVTDFTPYLVLPTLEQTRNDPFTVEEVCRLWSDYENGNVFTGFALLMIYTGMMPGEALLLKKGDINLKRREIRGIGLKTDKRRETPITIPEDIVPVLTTLMQSTDGKLYKGSERHFREDFAAMLKRSGCRESLKPYSCRHTTATILASNDTEINTIKEIMRHSTIATTARYVHVSKESVTEAINSIAPLLHPERQKTLV